MVRAKVTESAQLDAFGGSFRLKIGPVVEGHVRRRGRGTGERDDYTAAAM